jgi:ribosomal protein S18 acetylase RimI-like enzyme
MARLTALQRLYAEHEGLPHGIVWVDDDVMAVAVFLPPAREDLPEDVTDTVRTLHGEEGITRLASAADAIERHSANNDEATRTAYENAWLLASVGVLPGQQGNGLGSAVIDAGLGELDDLSESCRLETSDERTMHLYERLGFTVTCVVDLPKPGPRVWSMLRAA